MSERGLRPRGTGLHFRRFATFPQRGIPIPRTSVRPAKLPNQDAPSTSCQLAGRVAFRELSSQACTRALRCSLWEASPCFEVPREGRVGGVSGECREAAEMQSGHCAPQARSFFVAKRARSARVRHQFPRDPTNPAHQPRPEASALLSFCVGSLGRMYAPAVRFLGRAGVLLSIRRPER